MFYTAGLIGSGLFLFSALDDYNHGYDQDANNRQGLVGLAIWSVAITASLLEAYYAAKKINARIARAELSIRSYTHPKPAERCCPSDTVNWEALPRIIGH